MAENFDKIDDRETFEWNGISLTYTKHTGKKKGPLFILIGGWTSAPGYWARNLNFFLERGDVAVLDLVGHFPGDISPNIKHLEFKDFLEAQAKAILYISGKKKSILVGHSTGGMSVLGVAALFPEKVSKVITIAPVVYGPIAGLFKTAVLLHRVRLGFFFELGFSATQLSENFLIQGFSRGVKNSKKFFAQEGMRDYLNRYFPYFKRLSGRNMNMILDMLDRADLRPLMLNYKTPTLLLRTINDPIVPASNSEHLARDHNSIKEVLFNESGHFIHLEEQQVFEEVVGKFLISHQNS
jgi:pimeloyl-ACP methyl ester carboxylesterase